MAEYNEPVAYKPKAKKTKTAEQALNALMALCSRGERSSGDALRLMRTWGVDEAASRQVLAQLIEQRYIDDSRFANAFVRDKMAFSGWGLFKINQSLVQKGISKDIIAQALSGIEQEDIDARLEQMLRKKMKTTRASDPYKLKAKLVRSGASAGYNISTVVEVVNRIINTDEEYEM